MKSEGVRDNVSTKSSNNAPFIKHSDTEDRTVYKTHIVEQPVTEQRIPYTYQNGDRLIDAGTPRATIAPSKEMPNGSVDWARTRQHKTVIQQHVEYWDQDGDGIIWPRDTYNGFYAFGWSAPLSLLVTAIIHSVLAYPTSPSILPDPYFRIWVERAYKIQHGSDTMVFDMEGRYVPQNFENIFAKYDEGNKGGLTWGDVMNMASGQRMIWDFFGWVATYFEWSLTYLLLWPDDGIMKKEDIRCCFDGSIFPRKAEAHARNQKARKNTKGIIKNVVGRSSFTSAKLVESHQNINDDPTVYTHQHGPLMTPAYTPPPARFRTVQFAGCRSKQIQSRRTLSACPTVPSAAMASDLHRSRPMMHLRSLCSRRHRLQENPVSCNHMRGAARLSVRDFGVSEERQRTHKFHSISYHEFLRSQPQQFFTPLLEVCHLTTGGSTLAALGLLSQF